MNSDSISTTSKIKKTLFFLPFSKNSKDDKLNNAIKSATEAYFDDFGKSDTSQDPVYSAIPPKLLQRALLEKIEKMKNRSKNWFDPFVPGLENYLSKISNPFHRLEFGKILKDYMDLYTEHTGEKNCYFETEWEKNFRNTVDEIISGLELLINERLSKITVEEIRVYIKDVEVYESQNAEKEWPNIHSLYRIGDCITSFFIYYILLTENTKNNEKCNKKQLNLSLPECLYRMKVVMDLLIKAREKGNFFLYMYLWMVIDHYTISRISPIYKKLESTSNYDVFFSEFKPELDPRQNYKNCQSSMSAFKKVSTPFINSNLYNLSKYERQIKCIEKQIVLLKTLNLEQFIKRPTENVIELKNQLEKLKLRISRCEFTMNNNINKKLSLICLSRGSILNQKQIDYLKEEQYVNSIDTLRIVSKLEEFLKTDAGKDIQSVEDLLKHVYAPVHTYKKKQKEEVRLVIKGINRAKKRILDISYPKWVQLISESSVFDADKIYELSQALYPKKH